MDKFEPFFAAQVVLGGPGYRSTCTGTLVAAGETRNGPNRDSTIEGGGSGRGLYWSLGGF